jgi:hypothetical protein
MSKERVAQVPLDIGIGGLRVALEALNRDLYNLDQAIRAAGHGKVRFRVEVQADEDLEFRSGLLDALDLAGSGGLASEADVINQRIHRRVWHG